VGILGGIGTEIQDAENDERGRGASDASEDTETEEGDLALAQIKGLDSQDWPQIAPTRLIHHVLVNGI